MRWQAIQDFSQHPSCKRTVHRCLQLPVPAHPPCKHDVRWSPCFSRSITFHGFPSPCLLLLTLLIPRFYFIYFFGFTEWRRGTQSQYKDYVEHHCLFASFRAFCPSKQNTNLKLRSCQADQIICARKNNGGSDNALDINR